MTETKTQYEFKAEIKQLLDILVHSLYTNREIFLRELISNASDALDKIRFESNRGTEIIDKELPLEIKVNFDKKKKLLFVEDTGIGMTKDEIITNIGTIAKSGSAEFINQLKENKENAGSIIGKFGVGFYSVFMVAEKVVIKTKSYKAEEPAYEWISDGSGSYEIAETDKKSRGTVIEIHLKKDAEEFAEKYRLEQIIKKHSSFISFPIFVEKERVNTIPALWREPKTNIKPEQYTEFYKFLTYDNEEPFEVIHKSVDAPIQFSSLLFIPKKNFDFFGINREDYGLDLYVRRVLIQHQNKDLLPEYLSFVKGVVDSEDLPLNISRETLQENIIFTKISQSVTNQVLSHLIKLAKDNPEKYLEFWKEHGKIFKMGYSDYQNQEKFLELLRFNSSFNEKADDVISLADYVERMKKDQKEIYYISGSSRESITIDPHLEIFKLKGLEVLYLYEPADEFVISSIMKYKDYEFKSVDQVDLKKLNKLDNVEEKKESEKLSSDDELHFSSLLSHIKDILGDKVKEVRVSERLKDSPACLVNQDNSMSASMQKIMHIMNKDSSIPQKIMEVNKDHKLIRNLLRVFKADKNDPFIGNVAEQLYESALLLEGYLTDPHKLVNRINNLLNDSSDWYTEVKKIN
ncbi:MAG: molecular chaperone HtpG [Melioribacteraceae bacterium]|nr:molecular chaperone HtpG [Melioribacteraceae bacterium]MDD3557821.1 molecular chaperone HtpG [Melioribacteraceae bacterium]